MVTLGAHEGKNRRSENFDPVRMCARDDLLVCRNDPLHEPVVLGLCHLPFLRQLANIVDAFQNNQISDVRLCDHIACGGLQLIHAHAARGGLRHGIQQR